MRTSEELFQAGVETYDAGFGHYQRGDINEGARLCGEAARLFEQAGNHRSAMFYLAQLHAKGIFPDADPEEAVELYTAIAKEYDDIHVKLLLGELLCKENKNLPWNPEEGSKWIRAFMENISGMQCDLDKSSEWVEAFLNNAHINNNLEFMHYETLGDLYCTGRLRRSNDPINRVNESDMKTAIAFFKKAIDVADEDTNPMMLEAAKMQLSNQEKRLSNLQGWIENVENLIVGVEEMLSGGAVSTAEVMMGAIPEVLFELQEKCPKDERILSFVSRYESCKIKLSGGK